MKITNNSVISWFFSWLCWSFAICLFLSFLTNSNPSNPRDDGIFIASILCGAVMTLFARFEISIDKK